MIEFDVYVFRPSYHQLYDTGNHGLIKVGYIDLDGDGEGNGWGFFNQGSVESNYVLGDGLID